MNPKRKLPVLPSASSAQEELGEQRPFWQWTAFSVLLLFAFWLPLSFLAERLSREVLLLKFGEVQNPLQLQEQMSVLPSFQMFSLWCAIYSPFVITAFLAALLSAYVAGRFAHLPQNTASFWKKKYVLGGSSGFLASLAAFFVTTLGSGYSPWFFLIFAILVPASFLGELLGKRRNRHSS